MKKPHFFNKLCGNYSIKYLVLLLFASSFLRSESCLTSSSSSDSNIGINNLPDCDGGYEQIDVSLQALSQANNWPCIFGSSMYGIKVTITVLGLNSDGTTCKCDRKTTIWDGYSSITAKAHRTGKPYFIEVEITANCNTCCTDTPFGTSGKPIWRGKTGLIDTIFPEVLFTFLGCGNC